MAFRGAREGEAGAEWDCENPDFTTHTAATLALLLSLPKYCSKAGWKKIIEKIRVGKAP